MCSEIGTHRTARSGLIKEHPVSGTDAEPVVVQPLDAAGGVHGASKRYVFYLVRLRIAAHQSGIGRYQIQILPEQAMRNERRLGTDLQTLSGECAEAAVRKDPFRSVFADVDLENVPSGERPGAMMTGQNAFAGFGIEALFIDAKRTSVADDPYDTAAKRVDRLYAAGNVFAFLDRRQYIEKTFGGGIEQIGPVVIADTPDISSASDQNALEPRVVEVRFVARSTVEIVKRISVKAADSAPGCEPHKIIVVLRKIGDDPLRESVVYGKGLYQTARLLLRSKRRDPVQAEKKGQEKLHARRQEAVFACDVLYVRVSHTRKILVGLPCRAAAGS